MNDRSVIQFGSMASATGENPLRKHAIRPTRYAGQTVPARQWIVDQYIPVGTVTMISGDGGLGKSLLAMQLMAATALGAPWIGQQTVPCRSVGLFCEDDEDELQRRISDIATYYDADLSDPRWDAMQYHSRVGAENNLVSFSSVLDRETGERRTQWSTTDHYSDLYDWAVQEEARLVILDSLHDFFHGNENARAEVRYFVSQLRVIAQEINGAVVILSHPSVAGMMTGTGSSGSTAWNAAVRSRLYLTRPKTDEDEEADTDIRELKNMKANYAKTGAKLRLRWEDRVFVVDQPAGGVVENIEMRNSERKIIEGLLQLREKKIGSSAARNASNYVGRLLMRMPELRRHGVRKVGQMIDDLMVRGEVVQGKVGVGLNRHPIIGLVPKGYESPIEEKEKPANELQGTEAQTEAQGENAS